MPLLRDTYTYNIPIPKVRNNFWFFAVIISANGMDFDCTQKCNNISEAFNSCIGSNFVTQIQPWLTVIEGVFATLVIDVCFSVYNDPFFQFGKALLWSSVFALLQLYVLMVYGDGLASLCGYYPWFQCLQEDFHSHLVSRNLWICQH